MSAAVPLLVAMAIPGVVLGFGGLRPRWAAPAAVAGSMLALAALVAAAIVGASPARFTWAGAMGFQLVLQIDGVTVLYGGLAIGVGAIVAAYSGPYIRPHLAEHQRPAHEEVRFVALLMAFMAAMVGLALAGDLASMFIFFELTTVVSYLLIGFDARSVEARWSALMALLVTGAAGLLFLAGILVLRVGFGTLALSGLAERAAPAMVMGLTLIGTAALAKSAQVPLHFWLPRAMVAPTPVSAYLHSAAMVAAGVLVLQRLWPLTSRIPVFSEAELALGLTSIFAGSMLALTADRLKLLLAFSTVSQYGYVVALLGAGGAHGTLAASLYVLAHAPAKCALFLAAGAVTAATGEDRLSRLGGLGHRMPGLAVATAVAAAGLAGLPLTIGFWKDELFFEAMGARAPALLAPALLATAATLAYAGRFWIGLFAGKPRAEVGPPAPVGLVWPVVALAALVLAGGLIPGAPGALAAAAARATGGAGVTDPQLGYHLDLRPTNLMALGTYAMGGLALATTRLWVHRLGAVVSYAAAVGPSRPYEWSLGALRRLGRSLHDWESREVSVALRMPLLAAGALVAYAGVQVGTEAPYRVGPLDWTILPAVVALALAAAAALASTRHEPHVSRVLALSASGYALVLAFALAGAVDVALVAALVETLLTLLLLAGAIIFPRSLMASPEPPQVRRLVAALAAGALVLVIAWTSLSLPPVAAVRHDYVHLAPRAHAKDVVTAILADFRGLDTAGEITVVCIGLLGVVSFVEARARP